MLDTFKKWTGTALGACVLAAGLTACQQPKDDMAEGTAPGAAVNTLTEAEQAEGWQLLFDGESLAGWHGYNQDGVPAQWTVQEDAITFDPEAEGEGGDLVTDGEYGSFEFSFDWKIAECGNSGVMYQVVESEDYRAPYFTGPEYQILDNTCHPDAQNGPDRTAAANYDLIPPSSDVTKPAGEWNQSRIVIDGTHVEHWLNGEKVVEYERWSDDWKALVAESKFTQWPDYGLAERGRIVLQDHGDRVAYRNLKIREL